MRERDGIEELDLNERVLWVNIEVNVDHDVENANEGEDDDVASNRLDLLYYVDCRERNEYFKHLDVNRVYSVSSSVGPISGKRVLSCRF